MLETTVFQIKAIQQRKILKRDITLRADDRSKTYGDSLSLETVPLAYAGAYASGSQSVPLPLLLPTATIQVPLNQLEPIPMKLLFPQLEQGAFPVIIMILFTMLGININRRAIEFTATNQFKNLWDV